MCQNLIKHAAFHNRPDGARSPVSGRTDQHSGVKGAACRTLARQQGVISTSTGFAADQHAIPTRRQAGIARLHDSLVLRQPLHGRRNTADMRSRTK